jgi:hypothetical protein
VPSPQARRAALLSAGPLLVLAGLAALALASGGRAGPSAPCSGEEPRDLPGEAVELTAGDGLWSAWLAHPPVAGEVATVLWRAEGAVPPELAVTGVDGRGGRLAVEFGPSPVLPQLRGGGLRWPRPGREWGTRLAFPHAGCWLVEAAAGERRGSLLLWVRRA